MIAASDDERPGHPPLHLVELLERTGISRARFYQVFESKDALLGAVRTIGIGHLARELERGMQGEPPLAQIVRWVTGFLDQAAEPVRAGRHHFFVIDEFRLLAEEKGARLQARRNLTSALSRAISTGVALGDLPADTDVLKAEEAVCYITAYAFCEHIALRTPPTDEDKRYLAGFVLRGLGASAAGITSVLDDLSAR